LLIFYQTSPLSICYVGEPEPTEVPTAEEPTPETEVLETCFSGSTVGFVTTNSTGADWYDYGSPYVPTEITNVNNSLHQFIIFFVDASVRKLNRWENLKFHLGWTFLWYDYASWNHSHCF
jgi:hypothetical protein